MAYRNGNYAAFYVAEPFDERGLGAYAAHDFCHYQLLRAWASRDWLFPFNDSHEKTYNVRDGSSWELTLKPRLRERLRNSKNIILFLSSHTKPSKALTEEIEYGIGTLELPTIVVYPEFDPITVGGHFDSRVFELWSALPAFKRLMNMVPTVHVPMRKDDVSRALSSPGYQVQSKTKPGLYRL